MPVGQAAARRTVGSVGEGTCRGARGSSAAARRPEHPRRAPRSGRLGAASGSSVASCGSRGSSIGRPACHRHAHGGSLLGRKATEEGGEGRGVPMPRAPSRQQQLRRQLPRRTQAGAPAKEGEKGGRGGCETRAAAAAAAAPSLTTSNQAAQAGAMEVAVGRQSRRHAASCPQPQR